MMWLIICTAIVSGTAFRQKPALPRAILTVGLAWMLYYGSWLLIFSEGTTADQLAVAKMTLIYAAILTVVVWFLFWNREEGS